MALLSSSSFPAGSDRSKASRYFLTGAQHTTDVSDRPKKKHWVKGLRERTRANELFESWRSYNRKRSHRCSDPSGTWLLDFFFLLKQQMRPVRLVVLQPIYFYVSKHVLQQTKLGIVRRSSCKTICWWRSLCQRCRSYSETGYELILLRSITIHQGTIGTMERTSPYK
jgi:hypothetical protein